MLDLSIPEVNDNLLSDLNHEEGHKDEQRSAHHKPDVQDQLSLAMHLNFVMEVLLTLTPAQLAYFYLVFDC